MRFCISKVLGHGHYDLPKCAEYESQIDGYSGVLSLQALSEIGTLLAETLDNVVQHHGAYIKESTDKYRTRLSEHRTQIGDAKYTIAMDQIDDIVMHQMPKELSGLKNIDGLEVDRRALVNQKFKDTTANELFITRYKNTCKFFSKILWTVVATTDYHMKKITLTAGLPNTDLDVFLPEEQFSSAKMRVAMEEKLKANTDKGFQKVLSSNHYGKLIKESDKSSQKHWLTSHDFADLFEPLPDAAKTSSDFVRSLIEFDVPNVTLYVHNYLQDHFPDLDWQAVQMGRATQSHLKYAAEYAASVICDLYSAYAHHTQLKIGALEAVLLERVTDLPYEIRETRHVVYANHYLISAIEGSESRKYDAGDCVKQNQKAILSEYSDHEMFDTAVKFIYNSWMNEKLKDELTINMKFIILMHYILEHDRVKKTAGEGSL